MKTLTHIGVSFTSRNPEEDAKFAHGTLIAARIGNRLLVESPLYALGLRLPESGAFTTPAALLFPLDDIDPDRIEVTCEAPVGAQLPERMDVRLVFADGSVHTISDVNWKEGAPASWWPPEWKR